jgi:hypothetical protein
MAEFFVVPTSPQEEGGAHGHQPPISPWSPPLAPSHPRPRTPNVAAALSCRRQAKLVRSRMGERRKAPVDSHCAQRRRRWLCCPHPPPSHPRPRTPNVAAALSCRRQAKLVRSRMGERRKAPVVSHQHHCIDGGCRSLPAGGSAFGARGGGRARLSLAVRLSLRVSIDRSNRLGYGP